MLTATALRMDHQLERTTPGEVWNGKKDGAGGSTAFRRAVGSPLDGRAMLRLHPAPAQPRVEWLVLARISVESTAVKNASEQARRISVRLSPQLKATIERAAASRGQSLNQFLVATLAEGANEVLSSSGTREAPSPTGKSGTLEQVESAKRDRPSRPVGPQAPALQPPVIISLEPYSGSRIFA
jgi:hypothetical protein